MNRPDTVRICLVEDDAILGEALHDRLTHEGFATELCRSAGEAMALLVRMSAELVICDIRLPDMSGEDLLAGLRDRGVPTPVIFITGYGTIEQAVRLLHHGALDYFTKPLDIDRLLDRVRSVILHRGLPANRKLGVSPAMRSLGNTVEKLVSHPEMMVLIEGETGAGKEVVARLIHDLACADEPFEAVNCAAIPEELVASVLFGHERGAFTGAGGRFSGAFRRAGRGLLFLDEIGDMPLQIQVQLLRVIEERRFQPLGSETTQPVTCRLVAATNRDLERCVAEGHFREDLFYRLSVIRLEVPPLRQRPEDIPWLANSFLADNAARTGGAAPELTEDASHALLAHPWPGNVRELKNRIDRACLFHDGSRIDAAALGFETTRSGDLQEAVSQSEEQRIRRELVACQGRIQQTADALGISRKSLWQKMRRFGIEKP